MAISADTEEAIDREWFFGSGLLPDDQSCPYCRCAGQGRIVGTGRRADEFSLYPIYQSHARTQRAFVAEPVLFLCAGP